MRPDDPRKMDKESQRISAETTILAAAAAAALILTIILGLL